MRMAGIAEGKLNPADAEIYERTCENGGAKWPIYYYGERVKQDYAKAAKLYGKACELKSPIGCAFLGAFYRDGCGVKQSYEKAAEIFTKACEIDSGNGCYDLAELHEGGLGVRQDIKTAAQYLDKACELGDPKACDRRP